ncbi:MAG TPA: DUF2333 domain-containing protein, partial [Pseudoalteromonas sp.]|nr:DUF2333 domain-containing protein [Pseudoalteromonas sp.]
MSQHKGKIAGALVVLLIIFYAIAVYWSIEPARFNVVTNAKETAQARNEKMVTGYTTTSTLITVASTLLDKQGGYLSNDVMPPSVIMDDMPAWEYGALEMVRDLALSMRKDFSRSQSQSTEHEALKKAQPQFNISSEAWAWPSAEGEYQKGIDYLLVYRSQIANEHERDSQFYSRADNLRSWLKEAEKRLGSLSQRLSASVGQDKVNTDLAGNSSNTQATYTPLQQQVRT